MATTKCESQTLIATTSDNRLVAVPMRCRLWKCPKCGPRERRKLIARFAAGEPTTLLTLTTNPRKYANRTEAFYDVTHKVNLFFKRLRRRYPRKQIQYALVWETTKKGWPHAHVLLRAPFLPKAVVGSLWSALSGAFIVDIRAVHGARHAARYVSKYLTKDPQVPPGSKRYRASRNYWPPTATLQLRDYLDTGPFSLTRYTLDALRRSLSDAGAETHLQMPWLLVATFPPPAEPP